MKNLTCTKKPFSPSQKSNPFPSALSGTRKRQSIHFHGSAYVISGPRPADGSSKGCERFSQVSGLWPCLSIQYRLSRDNKTTFPAALQDGTAAYVYALETLKIPASQVVLAGQSAGGHIVLSMLQHLKYVNPAIHLPRCALLLSPWIDMSREAIENLPNNRDYQADYISHDFVDWGQRSFVPPGCQWDSRGPYFSFLGKEDRIDIPVFVSAGTAEVLYDDTIQLGQNLKNKGNEVELHETPGSPHMPFNLYEEWDQKEENVLLHAVVTKFIEGAGPGAV